MVRETRVGPPPGRVKASSDRDPSLDSFTMAEASSEGSSSRGQHHLASTPPAGLSPTEILVE